MLPKSISGLNRIILLLCLVSAVALSGVVIVNAARSLGAQIDPTPSARSVIPAQAATADRISFYNVPSEHKLETQLDYVDGRNETIPYPAALCAAGTVITQQLNLYAVKFVTNGCEPTVFQNLNLRWMGDCRFEFEHDPDARLVAHGPYGEIVIGEGHYPVGQFQLTNLPANTTSLSATMIFTNTLGIVQTGNVEFSFNQPHPGCSPTMTPTPTTTATLTPTVATATPTATSTELPPSGLDPIDEPQAPSSMYLPLVTK
ncbi:hypothetical protein BH10CHL1_BH10CHL1_48550 [soil metagenome]